MHRNQVHRKEEERSRSQGFAISVLLTLWANYFIVCGYSYTPPDVDKWHLGVELPDLAKINTIANKYKTPVKFTFWTKAFFFF